jgi:NHL repeat
VEVNNVVREVGPNGVISTLAEVGFAGFSGDRGLAAAAQLDKPSGVAVLPGGGYLIADTGNHRVREVHPTVVSRRSPVPEPTPPGAMAGAAVRWAPGPQAAQTWRRSYSSTARPVWRRVREVGPAGMLTTVGTTELNRRMLHNCADTFLNVVHHG